MNGGSKPASINGSKNVLYPDQLTMSSQRGITCHVMSVVMSCGLAETGNEKSVESLSPHAYNVKTEQFYKQST
ncbi:hypothetical protein PoB_002292600 [Plakobranchus ocellatus]|uniref:Uncharacterized protein n=1 Tax=Plakobranchus ocellatus TaxID=259542 RepID=A0AAV3ZKF6_9GAST|nr:hypothetical protein PoB_002292600 [Plakobranchus ocellatus]